MSNVKFPGIDKQVLLRLEEAIKRDVTEFQRDPQIKDDDITFAEDEIRNGGGVFLSAIKNERTEPYNDLRNQIDEQGNFLNDINFGLASPILPPKPVNAFEHNMNLTMEMQKLVNEHLRMEDYDEPAEQFDIHMDYAGEDAL